MPPFMPWAISTTGIPGPRLPPEEQEDGTFRVRIPADDTTYYKFSRGSWQTIEGRSNGGRRLTASISILAKIPPEK